MNNDTFDVSHENQLPFERRLREILRQDFGGTTFKPEREDDERWDIDFKDTKGLLTAKFKEAGHKLLLPNGRVYLELKCDFYPSEFAAIEVSCKGKPSGLSVTMASVWVQMWRNTFFGVPTQVLRELLLLNGRHYSLVSGGNGNLAIMALVPKEDFLDALKPVTLGPDNRRRTVQF